MNEEAAKARLNAATLAAVTRLLGDSERKSRPPPALPELLLAPGQLVAKRYLVSRLLKEGGMGVVFEANDCLSQETVALKVMRPELRAKADFVRFRHEFYLMATLRHPRLVEVRDLVQTDSGMPCLVMELVPGNDLVELLPISWQEAASVLYQVTTALSFLHGRRYIHHDIKPGNIRVWREADGQTLQSKLIDFGIMEPIGTARRSGLAGTPAYLPPEALFGAPSDHRLDLYSLGVMAVEMVTGVIPFHIDQPETFLTEKQAGPPNLQAMLPGAPPALLELIGDLMAAHPSDRPYDASVVLRRLRHNPALSISAAVPEEVPPHLKPSRLVGRDPAIAALMRAFGRSQEGPALALVRAGAGLGKTSLLGEFALRARLLGGVTIEAGGGGMRGAFGVLGELLRGLFSLSIEGTDEVLGKHAPRLVHVLPELGERYPGLTPEPHHADATEERQRLVDAVRAWLKALLSSHRLVLSVDDAQLADVASIEVLRAAISDRELAGLLLVLAYRPSAGSVHTSLERLSAQADEQIALLELEEAEVAELIAALFGPVEVYPKFVGALSEAGQKNPTLLIEILRRLVDENVIEFRDERWRLPRELSAMPLPTTLAEAALVRLARLGAAARRVLDALVVSQVDLPLSLLPALTELDERTLFEALDELTVSELVEGRDGSYRASRSLDRDKLYAAVEPTLRREIHGRVGALLERHYGAAAPRHAAELAEHFRLGESDAKALEYLAIACEALYEAQLLTDALKPLLELERLLTLSGAEKQPQDAHAWQLLLVTRQRLARVGLAIDSELAARYFMLERQSFLEGAPLPGAWPRPQSRIARIARLLAPEVARGVRRPRRLLSLARRMVSYFTATSYHSSTLALKGSFAEALAVAQSMADFVYAADSPAMGPYRLSCALVYVHQGRVREAEEAFSTVSELMKSPKLVAMIPRADFDSGIGGLHTGMTLLYAARGRGEASSWLGRFEAFVAERDQSLSFLMPNLFLAQIEYRLHRGEIRLVQEIEARYKAHHARAGRYNAHVEMQILVGLARAALASHNLLVAEALCAELVRQVPGDFFSHGWGACVSGELWRLQRLYHRSREALNRALVYAIRPGERSFKLELRALNALAELSLEEQEIDAARDFAERALTLALDRDCRSEYEELWALRTLGAVAIARRDPKLSESYGARLEALAKDVDNPLFGAVARKFQGELRRSFGDKKQADAELASVHVLFESLGYLPTTIAPTHRSSREKSLSWSVAGAQEVTASEAVESAETVLARPDHGVPRADAAPIDLRALRSNQTVALENDDDTS
jgi:tRNA A-37 threonylcarbamoyl transferase component Bud32/tetratricopeptide (TPR) repeat protein